jgi:microcystin-dependent protein
MAMPFIGEIRPFAFGFFPLGWAACNGQLLAIAPNEALFNLLGTTYGGNGTTTFGLPNLQGCAPIHMGNGFPIGQAGGTPTVALTVANLPPHTHTVNGTTHAASSQNPVGLLPAEIARNAPALYSTGAQTGALAATAISAAGAGAPFSTLQPSLTLTYCIALEGIFPSQS